MTKDIILSIGEDSITFPTPPVQYCVKCGTELKCTDPYVVTNYNPRYDSHTGKKILFLHVDYRCPNKKHWWDDHELKHMEYCTDTGISISHAVASSGWRNE